MLRNITKNPITPVPGTLQITRLQRKPETLRGCIILMHRQMTPPHPTIIPQVVVRVIFIHAQS